ncbi:hypothetical protein CAOG_05600 [Capsaspora owczarzaki ATCC 30864]|uniref:Uncharacterized protein n=1 Tax=Capsaspora owczarzaki (strain ATCC 30864) TaxID=595528 RepID=A0A0D2VUS4_CAPO3|nr:hypothetical protein CAOG_05600 [Capsaspora owczarzaki ATCC 30864]KJE95112.1 hypothetical protein CAOG_005600 [Capsaspora owczarzaki ATCC 30864]|eukprot:XP_004346273.1 hypothetical protein CAOG_05600 [Capsaspora owczarzaki ATCC 30864]
MLHPPISIWQVSRYGSGSGENSGTARLDRPTLRPPNPEKGELRAPSSLSTPGELVARVASKAWASEPEKCCTPTDGLDRAATGQRLGEQQTSIPLAASIPLTSRLSGQLFRSSDDSHTLPSVRRNVTPRDPSRAPELTSISIAPPVHARLRQTNGARAPASTGLLCLATVTALCDGLTDLHVSHRPHPAAKGGTSMLLALSHDSYKGQTESQMHLRHSP